AKRLDGPPLGCRGLRRNRKELPPHHGLPTTLDAKSGSRRISRQRVVCQPTKVRITCSHSRGAYIPTFYCGWDIIMGGPIMTVTDRDRCRLGHLLTSEQTAGFGSRILRTDLEMSLEE